MKSVGRWTPGPRSKRQAIIRTNADPIHWRIYAALGEMI